MTAEQLTDEIWRAREVLHAHVPRPTVERAIKRAMKAAERELRAIRGRAVSERQKGRKR